MFGHELRGAPEDLYPTMSRQRAHGRRALFQAIQGRGDILRSPHGHSIEHGAIVGMNHLSDRPAFLPLALEKHFHAPVSMTDSRWLVTQMTFDRAPSAGHTEVWHGLFMGYPAKARDILPDPSKWHGIWWGRGTRSS